MRSDKRNLWKEEEGGSVVETALLSLLFFPIICYAAFFYDFSLASLKSLEASRYAAWELTAMKLWDWQKGTSILSGGTPNQSMFSTAAGLVSNEVEVRWGDDLNGATSSDGSYLFDSSQKKYSGLAMTTLKETQVSIVDGELEFLSEPDLTKNPDLDGYTEDNTATPVTADSDLNQSKFKDILDNIIDPIFNFLDKVANVAFEFMGFNTQGFAESQFSFTLEFSKAAPVGVPVFSGKLFDEALFSNKLVPAKQKILVDAWDLKEGADVDEGYGHDNGNKTDYYHQVGAVYLLGAPQQLGNLEDLIMDNTLGKILPDSIVEKIPGLNDVVSVLLGLFGVHWPFNPVVRSYRMQGFDENGGMLSPKVGNDCYYKTEACIDFDKGPDATKTDGNVADPSDATSRRKFYTNVFKDTFVENKSPYNRVYKKLGGYYMGCDKSQQKRCEY